MTIELRWVVRKWETGGAPIYDKPVLQWRQDNHMVEIPGSGYFKPTFGPWEDVPTVTETQ